MLQFIKILFYNSGSPRGCNYSKASKLHTNCSVSLLLAGQLPIRRRQQFALPSPPPPRVLQASPSCDSGAFCLHPPQDPVHSLPVDVGGEVPVPLILDHFSHCFPHTLCPFFGRDCCPFSLWKTTLACSHFVFLFVPQVLQSCLTESEQQHCRPSAWLGGGASTESTGCLTASTIYFCTKGFVKTQTALLACCNGTTASKCQNSPN